MKQTNTMLTRLKRMGACGGRIALAGALALAFAPAASATTGNSATNSTPVAYAADANGGTFAFDSSVLANGDYTYLYAALSYTDYYTYEDVYKGYSNESSDESDATVNGRVEYDRGAFDAVSRATTNHGLHRGNYQGTAVLHTQEGNDYTLDYWIDQANAVVVDNSGKSLTVGLSGGKITASETVTPTVSGTETVTGYEVTGIKYVPVAVATTDLDAFKAVYTTASNGDTLRGGYGEGKLVSYTYVANVDKDTNGLKIAKKNADGTFIFSERNNAGTTSGLKDTDGNSVALKSISDSATAADKSVSDYLTVAVKSTTTYGDAVRVDFTSNYSDLGGAMQAVTWEYYANASDTSGTPLATYGTKFAADNWMHKSMGMQLGLTESKRFELPDGYDGTGLWKVNVYALGYADTTVEFTVQSSDLHGYSNVQPTEDEIVTLESLIAEQRATYKEADFTAVSWEAYDEYIVGAEELVADYKDIKAKIDAGTLKDNGKDKYGTQDLPSLGEYRQAVEELEGAHTILVKIVAVPTAKSGLVYTGKALTGVAAGTGYTVTGNTATNAGTYTATATPAAGYAWDAAGDTAAKTVKFTIAKGNQKITAKVAKKTIKAKKAKKKAQTFKIGAKASGKLSYTVSGKKAKKVLKVSKSGKVTVKKGAKKGTYKIVVKAAGTANYKAATKTITVKVK